MPAKPTAVEKLNREKHPKKIRMDKNFAGIKAGELMYVATPLIVDNFIRDIPHGSTMTVKELRNELAKQNNCDGTCAISTSIFVRMVGEASLEELDNGKSQNEIAPFWRVISSEDKVTKKLPIDPQWVDEQRELEKL